MLSIRALLARSLQGTSWQDLKQCLCKRSLQEVSWQDLCKKPPRKGRLARPVAEIAAQSLSTSSLGEIYARDLLARSLQETAWEDLCTRSL